MKKLASKVIENTAVVKGGEDGFGTGTKSTTSQANNKAELL